jgi:hypothetical protein
VVGSVLALADGTPRFDAGRIVPEGRSESFALRPSRGPSTLVLRTDGGDEGALRVTLERSGAVVTTREVALPMRAAGRWHEIRIVLGDVPSGSRVRVYALRGDFRDFHAWLVRE